METTGEKYNGLPYYIGGHKISALPSGKSPRLHTSSSKLNEMKHCDWLVSPCPYLTTTHTPLNHALWAYMTSSTTPEVHDSVVTGGQSYGHTGSVYRKLREVWTCRL